MTDHNRAEPRDTHGRFTPDAPATAIARVKDKADGARGKATQGIEANPLGILVGGLALGAIAGALIPRSAQEKEALAPLGKSLGDRARAAFEAARETGQAELGELGLTRNAARSQVRGLLEGLAGVAQKAGEAAVKSATERA